MNQHANMFFFVGCWHDSTVLLKELYHFGVAASSCTYCTAPTDNFMIIFRPTSSVNDRVLLIRRSCSTEKQDRCAFSNLVCRRTAYPPFDRSWHNDHFPLPSRCNMVASNRSSTLPSIAYQVNGALICRPWSPNEDQCGAEFSKPTCWKL